MGRPVSRATVPRGARRGVAVPVLHMLVGGALLLAPGRLLRAVGDPAGRRARLAARVLGARHLGQAVLLGASGGRVARLGAAVDGLHGASMVALGLAARRHRMAAMASGAAAAALAALELTEAADG
jgi:hypothetical protein